MHVSWDFILQYHVDRLAIMYESLKPQFYIDGSFAVLFLKQMIRDNQTIRCFDRTSLQFTKVKGHVHTKMKKHVIKF